jgi:prepilin-type N-terminal cleavage/methylation domain-containing protein
MVISSNVRRSLGFTLVELLVVIAIIVLTLALIIPAINVNQGGGRRASCLNKGHQLGLAMQNYASTYSNQFPPSAAVVKSSSGAKTIGGYSFLVKVLPFMEYDYLYKSLPQKLPNGDVDAAMAKNPALVVAMNTSLKELICPSNQNNCYQNPSASPPQFALTNYKAVGASTRNSLLMAADATLTPPYGDAKIHPDGALYPSKANLPMSDLKDGTSHTIVIMETIDDTNSRWLVGAEATLVGLPQASSPTGSTPAPAYKYFAPSGFDNTFGDGSAVARAGLRTFLSYDFEPKGADAGKYEDPGWAKAPPRYGPSSAHPAVAIVAFGDGSVMAMNKQVDAANLFFLITKDGNDPFNVP